MTDTPRTAPLPTTASEITLDWLDQVMRSSGALPEGTSVAEVHVDPAEAGVGFMGEVATVGLTYEGERGDAPDRVVVKFPSQSPDILAMMHPTRIYEREHRFYDELAASSPIRTPAIYHVTCEPAATPAEESYVLVMEDLAGHTLGDQMTGVSADQAHAALRGLAKHHARFWNGRDLDDVAFIPVINGPLNQAGQGIYLASLPGFLEAFGETISPEMREVVDAYPAAQPEMLDKLAAMPRTLVHFDYRADNLFFDDEGEVAVIDWQAISVGGGVADVGYFVAQNLSVEDRRANEDALLRTYHDTLVAEGVDDYPFEQFLDDYRLGVIYGWIIPVMAVGTLDFTSERAVALWTTVIERMEAAIFDHGAQEFVLP